MLRVRPELAFGGHRAVLGKRTPEFDPRAAFGQWTWPTTVEIAPGFADGLGYLVLAEDAVAPQRTLLWNMSSSPTSSPSAPTGSVEASTAPDVVQPVAAKQALTPTAVKVAVFVVLVYMVAVFFLWRDAGSADLLWTRRLYLLGGLEALAFAAAGAIFGVAVQRPKVAEEQQLRTQAEKRASEAEDRTAVLEPKANVGDALEAVIRAKASATGTSEPYSAAGTSERYAGRAPAANVSVDVAELLRILDHYQQA